MFKKQLLTILAGVSMFVATAQQTQYFIDPEAAYRKGMELFDEKNYLAARQRFEEIYKVRPALQARPDEVMMQNLEYYIAICAVEANDKDAETLLLDYSKKYHETDKRRKLYFYLGKYYYNNKRYNDAITFLEKVVDLSDLDNEQIVDYKFALGYSYFTKKKFKEAKPLFKAIKDIKEKYYYPANYYYAFISFYTADYNEALKSFTQIEDSKMYASVIPYYVSQIYFLKGDYDKTIEYVTKNINRSDVLYKDEMRLLIGRAYFQKSEYAKALPYLEAAVDKGGKAAKEDIYMLAYCQYQAGNYTSAIENFKDLNLLNEKMAQNATYALADCYLKTNQKDKARSAFQSASAMDYDNLIKQTALFNYGKLSVELNYSSQGIQALEAYLKQNKGGTYENEANELLTTALLRTKDYDKAYKIIEDNNFNSPVMRDAYQKVTYLRAVQLYNDKKYEQSLELVNKSLKYTDNTDIQAQALYLKGEDLYNTNQFSAAAQNYLRFIQLTNSSMEKKNDASKFRAYYNAGYCYFKQKNYDDAAMYFKNAINEAGVTMDIKGKDALQPDLYLRYADCSFVTKQYGNAITAYSKITEEDWNSAEYAQYQKGIIYGLQGKDQEKISALSTLVSRYPNSNYKGQAWFEIGETYLDMGNNASALTAYKNVIDKSANSGLVPKVYLKMGLVNYLMGKKEESINSYKAAVRQFPKTKEANEALAALKDIYVEMGRADEYFDFAKENGNININASEQDSLMYESAMNLYGNGDCAKAITSFTNYLNKFPNGFFASEAHWNKADCYTKAKRYEDALADYEAIIQNKYSKYYERALLKGSGIAYYEVMDYNKALEYYKQLFTVSSTAQNTYTAMLGRLKSASKLNKKNDIISYAEALINSGAAKESDLQEAYFLKGKSEYSSSAVDAAFMSFNKVTGYSTNEMAAESKYMVAKILYDKADYKASMDTCFKAKDTYASYEYWVVKTFILMADNYFAQGNSFQAKATLQSIIENYEGDKTLVEEAKAKLEKMKIDEMKNSRIIPAEPTDTLIMEDMK
jgi:tetratricopeptide (TPR) repeat protein